MGQPIFDGTISFRGGQNSGALPDRIGANQYVSGVNITTTDDAIGPRPGFVDQEVEVTTEGGLEFPNGTSRTYKEIFRTGKFQMSAPYNTDSGLTLIVVISGIIFQVFPEKREARVLDIEPQNSIRTPLRTRIEPPTQRLDQYRPRYNWSEAGRFLVIFDYPDYPVIIEGGRARRANPDAVNVVGDPAPEIPNASIGTFNQSRLFVGSHLHEFTAGDPVGSLLAPDAPITFQEIFIPAAPFLGQVFSLGSTNTNNPITAMGFIQVPDTATGIGPLFVSTKDAMYTYRTDLPRVQWESSPFGSLLLYNAGVAGQRSFTNVNSDLVFMSGDNKVRSLSTARNSQQKWADAPISREVRNWLKYTDDDLLEYTVSASVNNRVLISVDPFLTDARTLDGAETSDIAFGGLIVLELDNVSGLLRDATPVWAGLWTGLYFMELTRFRNDLYIWSKDPNNRNRLYKLDETKTYDIYDGQIKQITSRLVTRQYIFENQFQHKEEVGLDIALSQVAGDVTLRVDRKPESSHNWLFHRLWTHKARTNNCEDAGCGEQVVRAPHSFREINFGSPKQEECNPVTRDSFSYFRKIQYRLTINALNWKLENIRIHAELQEDDRLITDVCNLADTLVIKDCSDVDDRIIYRTPFDTIGGVDTWL